MTLRAQVQTRQPLQRLYGSNARPAVRVLAGRALAIVAAAVLLCWPALINRFPLLYPDSLEYLSSGAKVVRAFLGRGPRPFIGTRTEFYSIALFFLHRGANLWAIVAAQAMLTAWVVWLAVRSVCARRPEAVYLALMALLTVLTSIGWYVSFIMPDVLAPLLFLCLYLIVFAPEDLGGWEFGLVALIAGWAAAVHGSNFLLAVAECVLLLVLWLANWKPMRGRGRALLAGIAVIALSAATQIALHARVQGQASVLGIHPPYLMARALGDGPARLYLKEHCASLSWALCKHVDNLPTDHGDFLWHSGNIWQDADPAEKDALRREELPLVLATLRSYPRQQLARSWSNFVFQLTAMGPSDFGDSPIFAPRFLEYGTPGLTAHFRPTLQARNAMPQGFFLGVQLRAIEISLLVLAVLLPWAWRHDQRRLLGLAVIVFSVVPANAFVAGVLSGVDPRLQGRLVWLLFLLAGLLVYSQWTRRTDDGEGDPGVRKSLET